MNANLYALIEAHFPSGTEKPCLLMPGGPVIHYDDLAQASADSHYTITHPELDLRRVARGQVVEKAQALELSNALPQRPSYR